MSAEPRSEPSGAESDSGEGLSVGGDALLDRLDPLQAIPRVPLRELRLEQRLARWSRNRIDGVPPGLDWLGDWIGGDLSLRNPEILWRASGLQRPGLVAQFRWPRRATRLALGLEVPVAHAVVDRLLGFDRPAAESRLQLTPVEWGIWTYLVVRALNEIEKSSVSGVTPASSIGPLDLSLDRVGPDPFDARGLGPIVTIRWPLRVSSTSAAVRLWLPESLVNLWMGSQTSETRSASAAFRTPAAGELSAAWRAEAGFVSMSRGLGRLRRGGVLPLTGSRLAGTPGSPAGLIELVCTLTNPPGRFVFPAHPVADSGGRLIQLTAPCTREDQPREPLNPGIHKTMSAPKSPAEPSINPASDVSPMDIPVTLTVELGRVNLTVNRLADLKSGDVIELGRHSREPVELTSNGRLVARGELILIDTELGVRVTSVFL